MWEPLEVEEWIEGRTANLYEVTGNVKEIIDAVDREGDEALFRLTEEFDDVKLEELRVSEEEIERAYDSVDPALLKALKRSAFRIEQFHREQMPEKTWLKKMGRGLILGVKHAPLHRVGAYVPGGRASYPSTALMATIPARIAGVGEVCCCSPPNVAPTTLVALDIGGADEIFQLGGAQAITAMALGTETIDPVQKVVGPGNLYVTAAKVLLHDLVGIDFPAGPSEIAVLADSNADPEFIAADVLAQAEHDPNAACVLITDSEEIAHEVGHKIEESLQDGARKEIVESALGNSGYVLVTGMEEGVETVNMIAPEHLSIQAEDSMSILNSVENAGSIFVGRYSGVALGDYSSGANHILPTAGYSRMYSGLDVHHFLKRSTVQIIEKEGLEDIAEDAETMARCEGLEYHEDSIRIRRCRLDTE